jgi:GTPase Era involved in 16S rRNA processing
MVDYTKALEQLHVMAKLTLDRVTESKDGTNEGSSAIIHLTSLCKDIANFRTLQRGRLPKIGVFGVPKQGKSFLLNTLLGDNIFPSNTPPTTHCAVEMVPTTGRPDYAMNIKHSEGNDERIHLKTIEEVCSKQEAYMNDILVTYISITGDLTNPVLPRLIYVDTPGGETGFEDKDGELSNSEKQLQDDTIRALAMLNEVDIVLFCVRSSYAEEKRHIAFYKSYLGKLHPINVLTCRDETDLSDKELIDDIGVKKYGFTPSDTVVVSARAALKAREANNDKNWTVDILKKGNMLALKQLIERYINPDDKGKKERIRLFFWRYNDVLYEFDEKYALSVMPEKIHIENFSHFLPDGDFPYVKGEIRKTNGLYSKR